MSIVCRYILFIAVIYSQSWLLSTSDLHVTVTGQLYDSPEIYFVLIVNELKAVLLYCIDFNGNQFGIMIQTGIDKAVNLLINFNKVFQVAPLVRICGCDLCNKRKIHFRIQFNKDYLNIRCNNREPYTLANIYSNDTIKDENGAIRLYPTPTTLTNSQQTYIMLGNIGPYNDHNGATILPFKEQMVGCIDTFMYNNTRVHLIGSDDKLRPSCPLLCSDNICNGGVCTKLTYDNKLCNCANTALNGRYCNKSMTAYIPGGHNSYNLVRNIIKMDMKLSWKQLFNKAYCLMEIIDEREVVTMSTNMDKLILGDRVISHIDTDGVNFVNIALLNNWIVTINNNSSRTLALLDGPIIVNVGFTRTDNVCHTFEGAYDFLYDSAVVQLVHTTPKNVSPGVSTSSNNLTILLLVSVTLIVLAICSSITIIVLRFTNNRPIIRGGDKPVSGVYDIPLNNMETVEATSPDAYNSYSDTDDTLPVDVYDYAPIFVHSTVGTSPPLPPRNL